MVSMPAKPPPTSTKVRALRRSGPSSIWEAALIRSKTQLRTATASSMDFMPIADSPSPGMGKARVTEPAASTISS